MSVYSNTEILAALKTGTIICTPFDKKNVNGSSLDVTLGEWFYRTDRRTGADLYNPFDINEVNNYFGEPQKAIKHKDWCKQAGRTPIKNIPADHPIIVLEPGERILAHTQEFVGITAEGGTSSMQSRSTWGRNGVAVCLDAGWGDPGYINRWTMEIYNMNNRHSVVLPVGERVAQLVFYKTGKVSGEYSGLSGKYQSSKAADLKTLIKNWSPEQMLPRAYKDKRAKLVL